MDDGNNPEQLESRRFSKSILAIPSPLFWGLVSILGISISLLYLAKTFNLQLLHEFAVLGCTVTPILFIYEGALRRHFHKEMRNEMREVIDDAGIQKEIIEVLKRTMPESYKNLTSAGLSDAFLKLEPDHLIKRIRENKKEIKINKIWMPYINQSINLKIFIDSIESGNTYKILLWDPEKIEPLERRARAIRENYTYTANDYQDSIHSNIRFFQTVWKELVRQNKGLEKSLEVRLHNNFLATSLIGFDEYFLLGLYLSGDLATNGLQMKIDKDTSDGTVFFRKLERHFAMQWDEAYKEVIFSENGHTICDRVNIAH